MYMIWFLLLNTKWRNLEQILFEKVPYNGHILGLPCYSGEFSFLYGKMYNEGGLADVKRALSAMLHLCGGESPLSEPPLLQGVKDRYSFCRRCLNLCIFTRNNQDIS